MRKVLDLGQRLAWFLSQAAGKRQGKRRGTRPAKDDGGAET
ncbi:hypothetical protein ACQUET_12985 [Lactococcus lactis]